MTVMGMIGAGNWGLNWIRTLSGMPNVELRYCCDLNQETLERVQRQFPNLQATTESATVLADPRVQGVVIATNTSTHFGLVEQALQAGKDVLVEKPMALKTEEAQALTRLAAENGCILMVGHLLEYHPAITHIKRMIADGELGSVYYIYSQRLNLGTVRRNENCWWSLAPHDISVACRLLGDAPLSIQCRGQNVLQPHIADVVFATMEFSTGRLAHIHVSWLDPHKTRKLTVVGSKRMIVFDDTLPAYKLTVYDKGFHLRSRFDSYADWISMRQGDIVIPHIDATEPLLLEASQFVDCIRTRSRPIADGDSAVQVVSVLEHGQQSLDQGGVRLPLPCEAADKPCVENWRVASSDLDTHLRAWRGSAPTEKAG